MNMHMVYSSSAVVDRDAYLSISTSRRARFCKLRPEISTRDLECTLRGILTSSYDRLKKSSEEKVEGKWARLNSKRGL